MMKVIQVLALLCGVLLLSLVVDPIGNVFVSLALTGEIRKIDPQGNQSLFA